MGQFRFSSQDFPESERVNAFQDIYASIANVDIEPYLGQASFVQMVGQVLPNLGIYEITVTPHLSRRTRAHVAAESNDDLVLVVPITGSALVTPEHSDPVPCLPGEALLMPSDSVHQALTPDTMSMTVINAPRALIAPRVSDLGKCLMKKIAHASAPELRLLVGYARMLVQMKEDLSSEFALLASTQIHDLITLLLGARREESEIASKRGLRAARLKAVKNDIAEHISDSELSINQVAMRQKISPQYIRALFHSEETTFADYITKLRLEQIYRLLCNLLYIGSSISTLAFDMGFNNLSWFNRAFKHRFGLTPSEVRELFHQSTNHS